MKPYTDQEEKILNEITNFCEECESNNCCAEDQCVLYRIEKLITGDDHE